ncbi:hypothetical protein XBLMG947_1323 [Xanthomonas bromi]|uniref:Uncharacterized protein n=1 Tax=Xanthomonas bromi TaxID=56449 RepID=A0A1C3NJF8_9XANT|nr:hypothetical protein XBLMG947_1323 [Xanthomonas bromi]
MTALQVGCDHAVDVRSFSAPGRIRFGATWRCVSSIVGWSGVRCPRCARFNAVWGMRKLRGHRTMQLADCFIERGAHRSTRLVLARPPSRDPWRHGCRQGPNRDVLAACPAMVGGRGPCSRVADLSLCNRRMQSVRPHATGAHRSKRPTNHRQQLSWRVGNVGPIYAREMPHKRTRVARPTSAASWCQRFLARGAASVCWVSGINSSADGVVRSIGRNAMGWVRRRANRSSRVSVKPASASSITAK